MVEMHVNDFDLKIRKLILEVIKKKHTYKHKYRSEPNWDKEKQHTGQSKIEIRTRNTITFGSLMTTSAKQKKKIEKCCYFSKHVSHYGSLLKDIQIEHDLTIYTHFTCSTMFACGNPLAGAKKIHAHTHT